MFFFFRGGWGWGVQTSHLLYFAFPAPAHFLDLLHFTLFLLQILSIVAYFLHVSPASHPTGTPTSLSFLSHLPYAYFPVLLTLYAPLLYSNVHQEVALKNLKRWKRPASNSPKWSRSLARTFCHRA